MSIEKEKLSQIIKLRNHIKTFESLENIIANIRNHSLDSQHQEFINKKTLTEWKSHFDSYSLPLTTDQLFAFMEYFNIYYRENILKHVGTDIDEIKYSVSVHKNFDLASERRV